MVVGLTVLRMKELFEELKSYYGQFLQRGVSYGLSPQEIHEAALNLLTRIFGSFFLQQWVVVSENTLNGQQNTRRVRNEIQKLLFQDQFLRRSDLPSAIKELFSGSQYEMQLKDALTQEEWEGLVSTLSSYKWVLNENFQQKISPSRLISPEFLSYFYEQILYEYDRLMSLDGSSTSSNKKKKGAFFTPWYVIRKITDECIDKFKHDNPGHFFQDFQTTRDPITILDPSCGTGSFVVYAAESLYKRLKENSKLPLAPWIIQKNIFGVDLSRSSLLVAKFRLLCWVLSKQETEFHNLPSELLVNLKYGNSLFGICKDSLRYPLDYQATLQSISTTLKRLGVLGSDFKFDEQTNWITIGIALKMAQAQADDHIRDKLMKLEEDLVSLTFTMYWGYLQRKSQKVRVEDLSQIPLLHWALVFPRIMSSLGFDICLGNPPYGRSILSPSQKQLAKLLFHSCSGAPKKYSLNAAGAFIERAISLLKPHGLLGFIVPFSILRVEEFEALRDFLLAQTTIWRIRDEAQAFKDVTLEMCSLFLQNTPKGNSTVQIVSRQGVEAESAVPIQPFRKYHRFMIYHNDLWQAASNKGVFNVVSGDYGVDHRIFKKDHVKGPPRKAYQIPYLHSGRCVVPFGLNPHYFQYIKVHPHNKRFLTYFNEPRLISTAIGNKLQVAYKPEKIIPGTNVSVLELPSSYQFLPMLILLNSELLNYLLKRYILNFSRLTVYLHKYYTKLIPILYPMQWEAEFTSLASWLIFLSQNSVLAKHTDKRLTYLHNLANFLVYEIYFPDILQGSGSLLHQVAKYLKPLDISIYLDLVFKGHPLDGVDQETLDHLIQINTSVIYEGTNQLRADLAIKESKKTIYQTNFIRRIRKEL